MLLFRKLQSCELGSRCRTQAGKVFLERDSVDNVQIIRGLSSIQDAGCRS